MVHGVCFCRTTTCGWGSRAATSRGLTATATRAKRSRAKLPINRVFHDAAHDLSLGACVGASLVLLGLSNALVSCVAISRTTHVVSIETHLVNTTPLTLVFLPFVPLLIGLQHLVR